MINFKEETLLSITNNNKTPTDISFIALGDKYVLDVVTFLNNCNFTYDNGYGSANIPENLLIVFKDGSWLERGEYDGSEWWEYKQVPLLPKFKVDILNIT